MAKRELVIRLRDPAQRLLVQYIIKGGKNLHKGESILVPPLRPDDTQVRYIEVIYRSR